MYGTFFQYQKSHAAYFKQNGQKIIFKKGEYIVTPHDEGRWVYFLDEGIVTASFAFNDGSDRMIGFFLPGMSFAKSGGFFEDSGGDLEYITYKESTVYRIHQETFFKQLATDATFNAEYIDWLLRTQILLIDRVVYQGEPNLYRKCIRWVLYMAKYYGIANKDGVTITIALTQNDIASFLHVTRESVGRTLSQLADDNLIELEKKHITIKSIQALTEKL